MSSFGTLLWYIFGYGESEDIYNVTKDAAQNMSNLTSEGSSSEMHLMPEVFSYCLVALYYIVVVVILLNMFIAMLATSAKTITVSH